ncbi:MAG: hypothetical protein EOS61_15550 [Mesorhizobium sp.]|nr:MAG: hypothetical protein EOQ57_34740 [Mesorhizobium sp.]RWE11586.1 MAG: hypothetical protein EOS61_15550 [Mesorhizobium sp.]TIS44352.1 MAG: hypothetical protein E5W96_36815 [Mesorhizobium sp.]
MLIEIFYDRMNTAIIGEDNEGHIIYDRSGAQVSFQPRVCRRILHWWQDLSDQRELLQTAKIKNTDRQAWLTKTIGRLAIAGPAAKSTRSCRGFIP